MSKVISPRIHGILDYVAAVSLAVAPGILSIVGRPALILYCLAVFGLVLAVTSTAPPGLVKIVPMRIHAKLELVSAPIVIAMPWMADFDSQTVATGVFVAFGAGLLLFWLITDYEGAAF